VSGQQAKMRPRARPPLDETYFKRIAAIEYAVNNDDGVARTLDDADVVLVGVSRTSKTPLSIYLGYLGWKATNVPLVKGIDPPSALFEIDSSRVVGVTIDARRLAEIRSQRLVLMGGARSYADLNEIYEDLEHAAAIHKRIGCPVIDVSELSIEEIALRIIRAVERRAGVRGAAVEGDAVEGAAVEGDL
ncbi:MAG TPA: kinase/pyrophosphorylase, partial [Gaiellaceae bacterium]|nr:kinase/pyrophosphorylase [Gaiellaceae bacterium]